VRSDWLSPAPSSPPGEPPATMLGLTTNFYGIDGPVASPLPEEALSEQRIAERPPSCTTSAPASY
jgi:hypothetical protein